MMTGLDLFKRRAGSVLSTMNRTPQTFQRVGEQWASEDYEPLVKQISPVDTGVYRDSHEVEVSERQITLKNTAEHSDVVEFGNSNHIARAPIRSAAERKRDKLTQRLRDEIKKDFK